MRGIGLVTGESGSGKTTACRRLVAGLNTGLYRVLYRVLYVSLTTGNVMDLYKTIAWELGLPTERNRAALFKQIRSEVSRLGAENLTTWYADCDGDTFAPLGAATRMDCAEPPLGDTGCSGSARRWGTIAPASITTIDCNDADAAIPPGAVEAEEVVYTP